MELPLHVVGLTPLAYVNSVFGKYAFKTMLYYQDDLTIVASDIGVGEGVVIQKQVAYFAAITIVSR